MANGLKIQLNSLLFPFLFLVFLTCAWNFFLWGARRSSFASSSASWSLSFLNLSIRLHILRGCAVAKRFQNFQFHLRFATFGLFRVIIPLSRFAKRLVLGTRTRSSAESVLEAERARSHGPTILLIENFAAIVQHKQWHLGVCVGPLLCHGLTGSLFSW